jgi:hypothetical protein
MTKFILALLMNLPFQHAFGVEDPNALDDDAGKGGRGHMANKPDPNNSSSVQSFRKRPVSRPSDREIETPTGRNDRDKEREDGRPPGPSRPSRNEDPDNSKRISAQEQAALEAKKAEEEQYAREKAEYLRQFGLKTEAKETKDEQKE